MDKIWQVIILAGVVSLFLRVFPLILYKLSSFNISPKNDSLGVAVAAIVGGLLSNQVFSDISRDPDSIQHLINTGINLVSVLVTGVISARFRSTAGFLCGSLFLGLVVWSL